MRDSERGRERWREKQAPCGELDVGLIPGPRGHGLSQGQVLDHEPPGAPQGEFLRMF